MCSDHDRMETLVAQIVRALDAGDVDCARRAGDDLGRELRESLHFERDSLLPEYERRSSWHDGITLVLGEQQLLLLRFLDEAERALARGDLPAIRDALAKLARLLDDHHRKARFSLYPPMDATVPEERRTELLSRRSRPPG